MTIRDNFNQVYVQNAALAGGVGIGTMAGMVIHPWGAMLVGIVSGLISVVGIRYITVSIVI